MLKDGVEAIYEVPVTVTVASAYSDSQWEFHGITSILKTDGRLTLQKNNGNTIEISDSYLFFEISL